MIRSTSPASLLSLTVPMKSTVPPAPGSFTSASIDRGSIFVLVILVDVLIISATCDRRQERDDVSVLEQPAWFCYLFVHRNLHGAPHRPDLRVGGGGLSQEDLHRGAVG